MASPRAMAPTELASQAGCSLKQLYAALRALQTRGVVHAFKVQKNDAPDGTQRDEDYRCLMRDLAVAYVDQAPVMADDIRAMYAAIGSRLPDVIRRTPRFIGLSDDGETYVAEFSRYRAGPSSVVGSLRSPPPPSPQGSQHAAL